MTAPTQESSGVSGPADVEAPQRVDPDQQPTISGPAQNALKARYEAYMGNFTSPLSRQEGQPDFSVITGRVGPAVRTADDFLFGPALKIETKAGDAAQAILDKVWGNVDQQMTTLAKLRINGGIYGHVFIKLVTPKNTKPMSADNPPRLVVQNPEQYQSTMTDPDDCDRVMIYSCVWSSVTADGSPCEMRQTTTRIEPDYSRQDTQDDTDTWEIQNWTRKSADGSAWVKQGKALPWPHAEAPIVDWQNYPNPNEFWGMGDIDDGVINLNKQLHLIESDTLAALHSQGIPWLFSSGADVSGITPTPGVVNELGSPDAKVWAVSSAGNIQQFMEFSAQMRANQDEATSNPGVATGRMVDLPRGQLSGITVRLLYGPRIMRTEHERRLYGQGIREVCKLALVACGQEAAAQEDIVLTWQDPLPQDDLAMAQMIQALQATGIFSDHTLLSMIGQSYDTELANKKLEIADQAALQPVATPEPPVDPAGPTDPATPPGGQQNEKPDDTPPDAAE